MEKNLGEMDRLARIILGIVLMAAGLTFWAPLVLLAIYLSITASLGYDPVVNYLKAAIKNREDLKNNR